MTNAAQIELPGLDCGLCGFPSCAELSARLAEKPQLLKRCIPLSADSLGVRAAPPTGESAPATVNQFSAPRTDVESTCGAADATSCGSCGSDAAQTATTAAPRAKKTPRVVIGGADTERVWQDHLGREVEFILDHFPEEVGPREMVIPHNPVLTRELEIEVDDVLVGRPLGISCGCPVTHCGIVQSVDMKNGTIVWCVTGPLHPRQHGFKDIGYYSAQAYEGLITAQRSEVEIGRRYWFQPRMCMMQWRHSGLVNYMNNTPAGIQVRIEGLWIG
jgi:uncharacterized Fe-S cluster-containing protein